MGTLQEKIKSLFGLKKHKVETIIPTQPEKITKTTYVPISNNIYYNGRSYRVRMILNGVKYSKNFKSKKYAFDYRRELNALKTNIHS